MNKKTTTRKLITLFLALIMVLSMLPMTAFAANNRTPIKSVEVNYDFSSVKYGSTDYPYLRNVFGSAIVQGAPAYLAVLTIYKWNGTSWKEPANAPTGALQAGKYRYQTQVRVDGKDGKTYEITDSSTLKVNGTSWKSVSSVYSGEGFSYKYYQSPEFTIEKPADIPFGVAVSVVNHKADLYIGIEMPSFSVVNYVVGGSGARNFSKASGPSWITVRSNGIVGGTPDSVGENEPLVIRVNDRSLRKSIEFTVNLPITKAKPGDRIPIYNVEVNYDLSSVKYGSTDYPYLRNVSGSAIVQGAPARLAVLTIYKWNGTSWEKPENAPTGALQAGKYRYQTQVRVDGKEGDTHEITDSSSLKVNGTSWTSVSSVYSGEGFSYKYYQSPEFTINAPSAYRITVNSGKASDGDGKVISEAVKGTVVTVKADAPATGQQFDKWVVNAGGVTLNNENSEEATFTMPANNVTITATYKSHYHSFSSWTQTQAPTCTVQGAESRSCACGHKESRSVAALGHSYSENWVYNAESHWHECKVCGIKNDLAAHTEPCDICGYGKAKAVPGDVDGNEAVDVNDAIYTLYAVMLPDIYPMNHNGDFNGDGRFDVDDAIYLLMHTMLPDLYPLN